MLGRAGELQLTGIARHRVELLVTASVSVPAEEQGVHAEWRRGSLRIQMHDPQYSGPRGTFTVKTREETKGSLRFAGTMTWTAYALIIGSFTLLAAGGTGVLVFGDGSGDALVFGWSLLSLFGVMAVLGWALYPRQLQYQLNQLDRKLSSLT